MTAYEPMLRRIDQEIDHRRREIAVHQVEITRLEDSRKLLMRMGEDDLAAAEAARAGQQHLINGVNAKPMLIVRKTGSEDAPPDAPLGIVRSGKRKGLPRLRAVSGPKKKRPRRGEAPAMRQRILALIEPGSAPMTPMEIGNNLGLPKNEADRKLLHNQLYMLRVGGALKRDNERRYYR